MESILLFLATGGFIFRTVLNDRKEYFKHYKK